MTPALPAVARTLLITAALIATAVEPALAQSSPVADVYTDPTRKNERPLLLDVTLNGLDVGVQTFIESQGRILIPPQTAHALRIRDDTNAVLDPTAIGMGGYELNRQLGTISFDVPASQMTTLTLGSDLAPAAITLSPETTGIFMNYDMTVRKNSGSLNSSTDYGGLADVHAFAPDFIADSAWTYQSAGPETHSAPIRLDSFITWRPAAQALAVRFGDAVSTPGATARPFRFIGISAGTDHSAEPGWSSRPIASLAGSAQLASSIDLYVNGVRRGQLATAGGPFNLILPPGSYTDATHVVVTDLTGRVVVIPLNPQRFSFDLVQKHMLLWSAGLGLPRFSWGTRSNDYLHSTYGYGNMRYGITNQMTLTNHVDVGPGLTELESEIRTAVTPRVGLSGSIAHSQTTAGQGNLVQVGTVMALSDNLFFTAKYGRAFGEFNDAVSWSAREYDRIHGGATSLFYLPTRSNFNTQLSWEPLGWLTLSTSYHRFTYQDSSTISFAALTANANIGRGANLSLAATSNYDGAHGRSFGISIGISFLFGPSVNGSISASQQDGNRVEQAQLSHPLGREQGAYGWRLSASRNASDTYFNGEASLRTGHGIPAIGYSNFAGQSQTYLDATGAVGIVAGHAFTSDPVYGGIIIADVGEPNVPVLLNGYQTTRSQSDGLATIAVEAAGTPQHIEIDDSNLPLSAIPGNTVQIVTIRAGSGSVAHFGVKSTATGAIILITVNGKLPLAGTVVLTDAGAVPVDRNGRAWIPALKRDAVLILELPDQKRCRVKTRFDGKGGPGRIIGPLNCRTPQ